MDEEKESEKEKHTDTEMRQMQRDRDRDRKRTEGGRERERQTDRQRDRERQREMGRFSHSKCKRANVLRSKCLHIYITHMNNSRSTSCCGMHSSGEPLQQWGQHTAPCTGNSRRQAWTGETPHLAAIKGGIDIVNT